MNIKPDYKLSENKKQIPIITIQGVTTSGKSKLAMEIAEKLKTDIISADSRQVYKLLDIGTAKPTKEEQNKIKHHLIDLIYPNQRYNAGLFARDAHKVIEELSNKDKIPLIVGGTGFYVKALLNGLDEIPDIPDSIQKKLYQVKEQKGESYLYTYLNAVDPESAKRIERNDIQKILRALEVYEYTKKPISDYWNQEKLPGNLISYNIYIFEERNVIYERINKRIDNMMKIGLLKEIEGLLNADYKENDPGMVTVGYREFYPFFKGEKKLENCIELAKQHTRNYAKRQFTWFRKIDFDLTLNQSDIKFSDIIDRIREFYFKYSRKLDGYSKS